MPVVTLFEFLNFVVVVCHISFPSRYVLEESSVCHFSDTLMLRFQRHHMGRHIWVRIMFDIQYPEKSFRIQVVRDLMYYSESSSRISIELCDSVVWDVDERRSCARRIHMS